MKSKWWTLGAVAALALLILDTGTAVAGAAAGVELCLRTVIPALFPFLLVSGYLAGNLPDIPLLRPIARLCRMPEGSEGILLTGLLGGYPVGARTVVQYLRDGRITTADAQRLLGFCNNAGPAFIFGMLGPQFSGIWATWSLWGVHILSALITGILLPGSGTVAVSSNSCGRLRLTDALSDAVKTMGIICGWVVIFRTGITYLERWVLSRLAPAWALLITGLLELTNGTVSLRVAASEGARFLLAAIFLAWGGACVGLQTVSVCGATGTAYYFPGKLAQSGISLALAYLVQRLLLPPDRQITGGAWLIPVALGLILPVFVPYLTKIPVAFYRKQVYNKEKLTE